MHRTCKDAPRLSFRKRLRRDTTEQSRRARLASGQTGERVMRGDIDAVQPHLHFLRRAVAIISSDRRHLGPAGGGAGDEHGPRSEAKGPNPKRFCQTFVSQTGNIFIPLSARCHS